MRNFLITTVLALVGMFNAAAMNDDGHVLTDLWRKYEDARKADRPQKEAEILADIRQKALKQHLPVDFYDAATQYVNTVQRRDWKQRDKLHEELEAEVKRFDQPLITFLWMRQWKSSSTDELWAYVKDHPKGFQSKNPALYRGVESFLNGALKPFIRNDKEFVLWNLLQSRRYADAMQDEIYQELKKELAGSYPGDGSLEYYIISRKYTTQAQMPAKKSALQALQAKYPDQALGLYPGADLLLMEKDEMDLKKASSQQYQNLRTACLRFETRRKAFRGDEATLAKGCTGVEYLLQHLEGQDLALQVDSTRILVLFKNLYHANLTLRQGKTTVKTWKVANFNESFYLQDTVSVDLPQLADGNYTVEAKSGKLTVQESYTQFTLSMAVREDAQGRSVYVTDYKTGEPLPFVTIRLLKGDQEVANTSLRLNGFTPLPATFESQVKGRTYYTLEAVYGDRRSPTLGISRREEVRIDDQGEYCNIYLDRGAYNPGDDVQFKAVLYEGSFSKGMKVCQGKKVTVCLKDSEDNVLDTKDLKANEWGSVSGTFTLPTGLRGGYFDIEVKGLTTRSFRVDEFVLPSFDLTFDPVEKLYLPGSEVPVTGTVKSYSGHNLTGACVSIQVTRYGNVVLEQEQLLQADNRFAFAFPANEEGYYEAEVRVMDATGETLEFDNSYFVYKELNVRTSVQDALMADVSLSDDGSRRYWGGTAVIGSTALSVKLQAIDVIGAEVPLPVEYQLLKADGTLLAKGSVPSGESLQQVLPSGGLYLLKTIVKAAGPDGAEITGNKEERILCVLPEDTAIGPEVKHVFLPGELTIAPFKGIEARMGTGAGRVYAVATLFGEERRVLASKQLVVEDGQLAPVSFPYLDSYPDAVGLIVFYFKKGEATRFEREYHRAKDKFTLPLTFTRFQDKAYPGTEYTFSIKTNPGVEVLAAAWDKSIDAIDSNDWPVVNMRDYYVDYVPLSSVCGRIDGSGRWLRANAGVMLASKAAGVAMDARVVEDSMEMEQAPPAPQAPKGREYDGASGEEVRVRTDFASALTFQPHLYPKADGSLDFSFRTSDKLSTFYVRVFAHGKAMHNALCEGEMVVSLPVKVSLVEPRYLFEGDEYEAAVTVSSLADEPVSGVIVLKAGESVQQLPVTIAPGATETRRFPVKPGMTGVKADSDGHLLLTASFVASEFSDAVQVSVPVYPAAQQLTEAHSAVLRDAMSRDALLADLRSRFVNVPASEALLKEISVLDMVKDAIPSHVEPRGNDVLSLSEAWYIRLMASRFGHDGIVIPSEVEGSPSSAIPGSTGDLLDKILSCRNLDGGFSWFEGMPSNAIITAVLLERFALLRDRGFEIPDMTATVKFLDDKQFGTAFPVWCGWVSDAQYMRVRALYPEVPFEVKPVSATDKKRLTQFKKDAKAYLTPSRKDGRGLEGQILSKARRLLTLRSLAASSEGKALAKAWGIGLNSKIEKSIQADVTSLLEYAVEHRDGGWYYPNAVMPFRGLLESEAYAHALLCQLLNADSPVIADGIRLWLMLQKETQKWDTEPAFIDAIDAILDGSEAVLNTRVLALSASYEAPFGNIQASGNGFTVERKFFREMVEERLYDDKSGPNDHVAQWVPLKPGEKVEVGDKVRVEYAIWNAENRSFVKLTAGREASLRPVEQLSGYIGWGLLRPLRSGYSWTFTPNGYRNVKASATEYYFDSYPEENTVLAEEFFVTQAGRFQAPVVVIESLYAPHYRANSAYRAPLLSTAE